MADSLDVLTLAEAKSAIRVGVINANQDTSLARLITTVSRKLDECIGPVVSRTVTSERASGWGRSLELAYGPVTSVPTVVEYQATLAVTLSEETNTSAPSEAWVGERYRPQPSLLSGVLIRRVGSSDSCWWNGHGNVVVTYVAGRVASTTQVDARHKEAGVLILRNLWRSYENSVGQVDQFDVPVASFPTFTVPNAVRELLRDEWQDQTGFGF